MWSGLPTISSSTGSEGQLVLSALEQSNHLLLDGIQKDTGGVVGCVNVTVLHCGDILARSIRGISSSH